MYLAKKFCFVICSLIGLTNILAAECEHGKHYQNLSDFRKFLYCSHGEILDLSCSEGFYWNANINSCDFQSSVICPVVTPTTTPKATTTTSTWTTSTAKTLTAGAQAPHLEHKSQEEIDVVQPEGDIATLRCFATGYPLPAVTWRRGHADIDTNQGRYFLTSSGELQIAQVRRSDSGKYACVADNGFGVPVEREVNLEIADPVQRKAYILGETDSIKIVSLNQPATVRCLPGGYPKPYVTWWRGNEMLPFTSLRHEINRDFSLVFQRVELSDLGPYVCQAYAGIGKPVSMHVTLKAVAPVHVNNVDDEHYLKYLVSSPEAPTTITGTDGRPDIPVVDEIEPRSARVTAEVILTNGQNIGVGSEIAITCNVGGYPLPSVKWYKDDVEIVPDNRIRIKESPHQLSISGANYDDAGYYKCAASNNISSSYHAEPIIIVEAYVPPDCIDNEFFANCKLMVKARYCTHTYYAKFCCRSCALAGQISF